MTGLPFVGPDLTLDEDLAHKAYLDSLQGSDFTIPQIDAAAAAGLTSYATKSYVDNKDALNATKAYIDGKDALRIPLTQKNIANGVAGLGASGKAPNGLINEPASEIIIRGPWSPNAYLNAVTDVVTETTLFTCPVTDPGYAYKPLVFGEVDTSRGGTVLTYPQVVVRQGNETSGQIVARGFGDQEIWHTSFDDFNRSNSDTLGPDWTTAFVNGGGKVGVVNNALAWVVDDNAGGKPYAYTYRNKPGEGVLSGDYVRITFTVGTINQGNINNGLFMDIHARAALDSSIVTLVRFIQGNIQLGYKNGGADVIQFGPNTSCTLTPGSTYDIWFGVPPSSPRRFQLYKDDVLVLDYTETANNTVLSPSARYWGVGIQSNNDASGNSINDIRARDTLVSTLENAGQAAILPARLDTVTSITGATNLYVRLVRTGTAGKVAASAFKPSLYVQAVPA